MRGLWLTPRVHDYRDKGKERGDPALTKVLDCEFCEQTYSRGTRATWHCGRLPIKDWRGNGYEWEATVPWTPEPLRQPGESREDWLLRSTCPGFLVTQDKVLEAVRAHSWRKNLGEFYGEELTPVLFDAIDVYRVAQGEVEAARMREAGKGGK